MTARKNSDSNEDKESDEESGKNNSVPGKNDSNGDDAAPQGNGEDDGGDKEETQDGKQPSKEGDEKGEDDRDREQHNELPDISSMKSCSREDITEFVAKMRASDKECDLRGVKATGNIMREWLQLSKTPKGPIQMEFFYLFEPSHRSEIAT